MIVSIFLHIFFYDIWFYYSHIILHNYMSKYHKIHHSKPHNKLTYRDTNTGHYLETTIQPLGFFIPFFIVKFSILNILISSMIIGTRGLMRHDNRFSWIIGNHHLLHHKYQNYNFGEFWIDKLFGTDYPTKEEYIYGIIYT